MSPANSLNGADLSKWGKNLLVFLAPVAVVYLLAVIASVNSGGVSAAAFVPNAVTQGAMVLYVLNALLDIIRKFLAAPVVA